MIPPNKRNIFQIVKIKKSKTNINNLKNPFSTFSKTPNNKYIKNIQNMRYNQQDNQIITYSNRGIVTNDIKVVDIKNIPNEILYKKRPSRYHRNKLKNNMPNKISSSYSCENISNNSFQKFQNNTYTQRTIETYEIPLTKNYSINQQLLTKTNDKENHSMDITYYKPIIYINKNENNNSFLKKSENNDFFTQNNSLFLNGTNIEDNITNINLNNTINYDKEKYYKQKNIITTIRNIPKPKKFKRGIPPIPIKKINESNNSFYFEDNEINNNININNNYNNYNCNTNEIIKNEYSSDNKKLESTNLNTNTNNKYKKWKISNKKYSNKTYSKGYIKNIEKIGIQLSFTNNKIRNESIDLISPEILKNLKQYSTEKTDRDVIYNKANMNMDRITEFINIEKDYETFRKKYNNKLSFYLLKNKKKRISKKKGKKDKFKIIDIKTKIKEEKRNRSLSNLFKFKKREIIKDSPSATNIKKQDDIGGKIDLKFQNIKNQRYLKKKGIKRRILLSNLIKQCKISQNPKDQGEIIINAAKTIQKWWRDLIYKIIIIINTIKIQSKFRSFITRKKLYQNNNINLNSFKKEGNIIYKKTISKSQTLNNKLNLKERKSRNNNNLQNIISNNSFKIVSNEDLYQSIKKEEDSNSILIMNKNNLSLCFYTKDYYKNIGEKYIIFIQRYFKNYLKRINKLKNDNIIKFPLIPLSFIEKIIYKNKINNNNEKMKKKTSNNITHFSEKFLYMKKKKPVIFSISKINYETLSKKNEKNSGINNNLTSIYKIPNFIKSCYFDKIYINKDDNANEKIKIIRNVYKNWSNKKKFEKRKTLKKNFISSCFISKEYFNNNLIDSDKISLVQNIFRKFIKNKKNIENKLISEERYKRYIKNLESINSIITNIIKRNFINYFINKLKKHIKLSREKYFINLLSQIIKKIIIQFTYEKLKLYHENSINLKQIIKNLKNKDNNETRKSDEDIKLVLDNLKININQNEDDKFSDNDSLNENLNINLTINEESKHLDNKNLQNKKLQNDRYSFDSNIDDNKNNYIKKTKTYSKYNNYIDDTMNNNIDNSDKNTINTEYTQKNHRKNNNFIRNFILRKKLRNANKNNKKEEIINSYKNNFTIDYSDQSNVLEEDNKLENSNKKINKSLLKKKMKTIEPIPNHIRKIIFKANSFRNNRKELRKKQKETIKLRDSSNNFDYEYYENY